METADLKQRITQGENTTTEFKENFDQEAIETAAAFANTEGGTILIGVSDRREVRGITVGKETLRNWSNQILQATEPRVVIEIKSVVVGGKLVLLIHTAESPVKPVSVKGRCYKRVGNSNRVMSPQEIAQMHLNATGQTWDHLLVTRADARVFIFDTRVEIINPGAFPKGVSPDEPVHEPVNPILSQFMYDVGFIERYGTGIKMMKRLSEEWGNEAPRYEFHPLETKIIFESPIQESTYIEIDDISEQLNERQKNAFSYVQRHGQIATKNYVEINHVSRRVAYEELRDMTDKRLLSMIGKGRGSKYVRKLSD